MSLPRVVTNTLATEREKQAIRDRVKEKQRAALVAAGVAVGGSGGRGAEGGASVTSSLSPAPAEATLGWVGVSPGSAGGVEQIRVGSTTPVSSPAPTPPRTPLPPRRALSPRPVPGHLRPSAALSPAHGIKGQGDGIKGEGESAAASSGGGGNGNIQTVSGLLDVRNGRGKGAMDGGGASSGGSGGGGGGGANHSHELGASSGGGDSREVAGAGGAEGAKEQERRSGDGRLESSGVGTDTSGDSELLPKLNQVCVCACVS